MRTVKRAVVVWDHMCGTLREDDEHVLGFDLAPGLVEAAASLAASGCEVTLAIPGWPYDQPTDMFAGSSGLRVVPLGPLAWRSSVDAGERVAALSEGEFADTAFVSADRRLRGDAAMAGMQPVAHAAALPFLARGEVVQPARVAGPKTWIERLVARGDTVPLQFQPVPGDDAKTSAWALFAWFAPERLVDAALQGLSVMPLNYDPGTHDLVWVRLDDIDDAARAVLAERGVLYAEPGQILIALGPDDDVEVLALHGEHGHTEFLAPDPGLLKPPPGTNAETGFAPQPPSDIARILQPVELPPIEQRRVLRGLSLCKHVTAHYESDLNRYSGVTALDAAGPIDSRHILHPDNRRVETQLLADLRAMGYCAHRHHFVHAGATYSNIIADLPGAGWFRVQLEILARLRKQLARPHMHDLGSMASELEVALDGPVRLDHADGLPDDLSDTSRSGWADLSAMPLAEARRTLEAMLKLHPWYPWWNLRCPLPGWGAGLVIVGAHLDSTAGFDPGYAPSSDAAPGRDDNASGLAAVLSLARHFRSYAGQLRHTVRLCLFNAEEAGLVGSKAYAAHLKALGAPVRSVVCLDMIGYNADANRIFEIHTGYTDPAVRDLGVPMADSIAAAAAAQGRLAPAQIYRGTSSSSGAPDRNLYDGAINRSDHAAFQQHGWGAALVSEDFFANLASEPAKDSNPNYHRGSDSVTDLSYARDIVCAVARTVGDLAD